MRTSTKRGHACRSAQGSARRSATLSQRPSPTGSVNEFPDQLTLDLYAEPTPQPPVTFDGLDGEELDEAWREAGCPVPVPYNCIPF